MRFELCWVGRGYETIYLGNPSEASREIHLDKALASYSTFSLSCRELENPEKIVPSWIWEYQRKIGWSEMRCYPHNFLLNFFRGCQCNQCQTDSKKNWFSSNLICEQRRAIWNIQKIVLRYLPQMSRRPIKSLFHCHQEIVGKQSSLNIQHYHCIEYEFVGITCGFFNCDLV